MTKCRLFVIEEGACPIKERISNWEEKFVTELMQLSQSTTRDPSTKEIANIPCWGGDISENSPTTFLRELTTYLS